MQRWEYKTIKNTKGIIVNKADSDPSGRLNELGEDGWELVESIETALGGASQTTGLVLKRPKQ